MRTLIPYRTILAAVARGELAAVRPSGRPGGQILISETSWTAWLSSIRVRPRAPRRRLEPGGPRSRPLSDLILR